MPQVMGTINSVSPRQAGNKTIYDIDVGGQVYSTFDPEAMRQASQHVGQTLPVEVEVKQNGQFTNYWFNGIPGAAPAGPTSIVAPQAAAMPVLSGPPAETQADKEARITKLASRRDAVTLVAALYEGAGPDGLMDAVNTTKALAKEFYRDIMGAPPAPVQAVPDPPEPDPAAAQAELPDW